MAVVMNHTNSVIVLAISYLLFVSLVVEGYLGINWGRLATQRMIPSMVVDMMLQNNITEVKTFSASMNVLEAFGGSGIKLAITLPNQAFKDLYNDDLMGKWIDANIQPYVAINVNFRYVFVGTQPLSNTFRNLPFENAIATLDMMQKGLESKNITGVKATFAHYTNILNTPLREPSMAEFRPEFKEKLFNYCSIITRNNAPFAIDMSPLGFILENFNNDTEFAFFENNSASKFKNGEFIYNNVFEVMYDSVVCAIEKLGFHDLSIIVGSIGWPTDGLPDANLENAERFHQGLAKFIKSEIGTPRRPGSINVYIHNMADENSVRLSAGSFLRHFGIYRFDGQPKFNLDFTGNELKVKPAAAVGITHMPKRWCVLDASKIDPQHIPFETLDAYYNASCTLADCTSLVPGGSCSSLSFPLNYSYAFNAGFQAQKQSIQFNNSCDYGGYGIVVPDDPSTPSCKFPIEIIAAETTNFLGQGEKPSLAFRPSSAFSILAIVQFMLFILCNLM